MSDSDAVGKIMQEMQRRREEERDIACKELAVTCDRLKELGVTEVHIAYDGCGDSGVIESVSAFAGEEKMKLLADMETSLENAVCHLLPGGWELNDGSFGELVLDVAGRTINRQHNWRSTEYDEEDIEL